MTTEHGDVVIQVKNLTKVFILQPRAVSLRQELGHMIRRMVRLRGEDSGNKPFYALQGVTFDVRRGESVAIVGHNGAGKSTLLQIIANIRRPTSGMVRVRDRYVALLGLATGFDETMVGRKNIYLNAAIHGLNPPQVDPIMDDIIDFAEIRRFVDTPIKDYSTGMRARLAFSIAIHMAPEMIFLDEVLSVGDAAFQEKCQDKIRQMRRDNKTILFVSHSSDLVRDICDRAIWLKQGRLVMDGDVNSVLDSYLDSIKLPA